jgi:CO/xanthine dehydrogenase FAD-binding subunit
MMNLGIVKPELVLSLNHVSGLDGIAEDDGRLVLGGMVRHARVASSPLIARHCPALAEAARVVGDVQVRNRGTIGGSLAHADPAADYLPVLAAVGASVRLRSAGGERTLAVEEFLIDIMTTAREPSELVTAVVVPKAPAGQGAAYKRLARVEGSFAIVNAAAVVAGDGASATVSLGGVGPSPVTLDVSEHVRGGIDEAALRAVGDAAYQASDQATGDVMTDADYRREMARVFARRALAEAAERAREADR